MNKKLKRILFCTAVVALLCVSFAMPAFAAGDVATAIENLVDRQVSGADGSQQRGLSRGGYDPRYFVFRKNRHGIFRLPKARAVRVCCPGDPVRLPHFHADRSAVYLVDPVRMEMR